MYKKCIICGSGFESLVLNSLKMRQCKNCGLVWRERLDLPINYYRKRKVNLAEEKIKTRIVNCRDRINTIKKYIDFNNLCDIGCGEGIFLNILKQKRYKNLIGIEPSPVFVDFAQKNNLEVFRGKLEKFSEIRKKKDIRTVTMFHLIEHLNNAQEALKLIYDNLPREGRVIIETPNINAHVLKKANYKHKLICPEHLFYFNTENLKKLLKKTGFKIIHCGKRDFNQYNLPIKESLFRLGLSSFLKERFDSQVKTKKDSALKSEKENKKSNLLLKIIRKTLSRMVVISRRLNYIWIVAEK